MKTRSIEAFLLILSFVSCEVISPEIPGTVEEEPVVSLIEVAQILSAIPIGEEQMSEVFSAVTSSSGNGYDEEYTMKDLFSTPGAGVGDDELGTKAPEFSNPMKGLIEGYLIEKFTTKSGKADIDAVQRYIDDLASSDVQIYWPFSEDWDRETMPVITFDPRSSAENNIGYMVVEQEDGTRVIEEMIVNEEVAKNRPVWVVNRNDDSGHKSLDMLRKENPDWGLGGDILVKSGSDFSTKSGADDYKMLVLKEFCALRNFDSWFGGASEFFVKCGAVEGFTASTEAEMRLYSPSVTDFMIVVKRRDIKKSIPFNAVLIADLSDQLEKFAFLVTEDDGGTVTSWKTTAVVKVNSKSYGIELEIPYRDRDDIVWRGTLPINYFEKYSGQVGHFGDVDLVFEIM
uniref:Uncharacterized protein n=1 Tax=uncultured bacterium pUR16A2 TaxID=1204710 RepID=R9QZL6_9BACT|nr:hypothetical protein [uncultured bacterium pUR16A2]